MKQKITWSKKNYQAWKFKYKVYLSLMLLVDGLEPHERSMMIRRLGVLLWDGPARHSGKISKALIAELKKNPKTKKVSEHANSAKMIGKLLIDKSIMTEEAFITLAKEFGLVHFVTQTENAKDLKAIQKTASYGDAEEIYRKAGVELVEISKKELKELTTIV